MGHEAQPGLVGQVLGHVPAPRQAREEREDPRVEQSMRFLKGIGVAAAQASDQIDVGIRIHNGHNAELGDS